MPKVWELRYLTGHGLSQSALGRQLGMARSVIARSGAGGYERSLDMLVRLSRDFGLEFRIEITLSAGAARVGVAVDARRKIPS
jgi:transcriptional regulator with XRE-family HTH domain